MLQAFLLLIFFLSWPFTAAAWTGEVVGIIDGDSLRILRVDLGEIEARLYGIDAPEFKQPFGRAAKKHLGFLLAGQQVEAATMDRDNHGRFVVVLRQAGRNINEMMVRQGYAWVYRHYCRESYCRDWLDLEMTARLGKRGLWRESRPVPPWEFRHRKR